MPRLLLSLLATSALLSGCGLATVALYDGPEKSANELSVISGVAIYPDRLISINVWKINNKDVDHNRTSEFLVLPGNHLVQLYAKKDMKITTDMGLGIQWKEAYLDVPLQAEPGHTYIADVVIENNKARGLFRDMGFNFNKNCMPLRRFAIAYGGSSDGKTAACPN